MNATRTINYAALTSAACWGDRATNHLALFAVALQLDPPWPSMADQHARNAQAAATYAATCARLSGQIEPYQE